jgi:uncharacterized membrane protein/protein-disulfide isomerase
MRSTARGWLIGFAALGLVASGVSTWVHYKLLREAGFTSFCDISSTVSCTDAYLSQYGSLFGVPVSLLGLLWFIVASALAWVAFRGRDEARKTAPGYLFVLSTIGLAMVLYLGYASLFILHTICPFCITTYVAVIGLFIVSGSVMDYPMSSIPRYVARDIRQLAKSPLALAIVLVFVAGAATAIAFFPRDRAHEAASEQSQAATSAGQSAPQQTEFERMYFSQPIADPGVPMEGAKVLIVKFNDFMCPACGESYREYKPIFAKYDADYPGAVRIVVKDYPLDPKCNFNTPTGPHPAACEAAVAVRLAAKRNKTVEMEEWLYAHQNGLTAQAVKDALQEIAGVTDFDAQYPSLIQHVKEDIAAGGALGIRSTPTFFINGRMIKGMLPPQYFEQAIKIELGRAGVKMQ